MTLPSLMTASAQPGESGLFHSAKRSSIFLLNDADFPRGPDTHPMLTVRVRIAITPVIVPSFTEGIADIRSCLLAQKLPHRAKDFGLPVNETIVIGVGEHDGP